jgi:lipopolysaccharide transport system ATP-binding protein
MNPEKNNGTEGEVLVRVEGVSKKFCRSLKKSLWYGLCDIGAELNPFRRQVAEVAGRGLPVAGNDTGTASAELAATDSRPVPDEAGLRPDEFYAVRNVSFELRRGECLGLIGHNGAGKTTLLKMLNGLIKPDAGTITMRGRVGALIALGAGFNPILTGRENIYVNGSVLGLSKKEIDEKMDEIIDFAEIGKFIDTPVQNYSSGMSVRLGFSAAVCLIKPDILILDEVLAVGDAAFRVKCLSRVTDLRNSSATIFVSHDALQISRSCTRAIWMKHGKTLRDSRDVAGVLAEYASDTYLGQSKMRHVSDDERKRIAPVVINGHQVGCGDFCNSHIDSRAFFTLGIRLPELLADNDANIRLLFLDEAGEPVIEVRQSDLTGFMRVPAALAREGCFVSVHLRSLPVPDGIYSIRLFVSGEQTGQCLLFVECVLRMFVRGRGQSWAKNLLGANWTCRPLQESTADGHNNLS